MGMSYPMLAATLAKVPHDPDLVFCTEPGVIDWEPPPDLEWAPIQVSDPVLFKSPAFCVDMTDTWALP